MNVGSPPSGATLAGSLIEASYLAIIFQYGEFLHQVLGDKYQIILYTTAGVEGVFRSTPIDDQNLQYINDLRDDQQMI